MDTIAHTITIHEQYAFDGRRATASEASELRMQGFRYFNGQWSRTITRWATKATIDSENKYHENYYKD